MQKQAENIDRTALLENTVYPCLLETCSLATTTMSTTPTADPLGTAAILSYIQAILDVLRPESPLAEVMLDFLVGRMKDRSNMPHKIYLADLLIQVLNPRHARAQPSAAAHHQLANWTSSDIKNGLAGFGLLYGFLSRFGDWSLELLDAVPDRQATLFPFQFSQAASLAEQELGRISKGIGNEGTANNDAEEDGEEEEGLIYHSRYSEPANGNNSFTDTKSSSRYHSALRLPPDVPSEFELLLRLVPSSTEGKATHASTPGSPKISNGFVADDGIGQNKSSTGYAAYLRDAELSLLQDGSFRKGLALPSSAPDEPLSSPTPSPSSPHVVTPVSPFPNSRSFPCLDTVSSPSDDEVRGEMQGLVKKRHLLLSTSPLLKSLLESLAAFFTHTPEVNLALTAILAKLALCPCRSLDGWLLPRGPNQLGKLDEAELFHLPLGTSSSPRARQRDQAEAKNGHLPLFLLHQVSPSSSSFPTSSPGKARLQCMPDAAVFGILSQLLDSVDAYRRQVSGFDRFLDERRKGMVFAEQLAEALDEPAQPASIAPTRQTLPRSLTSSSSLSTTPIKTNNTKAKLSPWNSKKVTDDASLSPYALHYVQTGEIMVTPFEALTPARRKEKEELAAGDDWRNGRSAAHHFDDENHSSRPTTPTKSSSSSWAKQRQSRGREARLSIDSSRRPEDERRNVAREEYCAQVSLSALLDNVVILEEAVKELVAIVAMRKSLGIDRVDL